MPHTHDDQNYQLTSLAALRGHLRQEHEDAHLSLRDLQWGSKLALEQMHRGAHPEAAQFEPSVTVKIYPASITIPEFRKLRDAASQASRDGQITWIKAASGMPIAAIVPVKDAREIMNSSYLAALAALGEPDGT